MTYGILKKLFWGIALLAPLSLAAQEFGSELQMSDKETTYWYRICSAAPGMDGLAMTGLNSTTDVEDNPNMIFMMPTETMDHHSLWRLTAGKDGKVIITNRATGFMISNSSEIVGDHNITCLTTSSQGFTITNLGDNTFKFESVEDDGVNRCLALADKDGEVLTYPESGESSSAIAWKFIPVEIVTGIGTMKAGQPVIQVKDKRISVTDCPEWQLFNAAGEEMPRTVSLPIGVYMVKMPQRTIKVLVP